MCTRWLFKFPIEICLPSQGLECVCYIVAALLFVMYMFGVIASLYFGKNDPARFGTVPITMLTLFQVGCMSSWNPIAYTSWYGCAHVLGTPYAAGGTADVYSIGTKFGDFPAYICKMPCDFISHLSTGQLTCCALTHRRFVMGGSRSYFYPFLGLHYYNGMGCPFIIYRRDFDGDVRIFSRITEQ